MAKARQNWELPTLTYEGDITEIVLGGGGKESVQPHDPGEIRNPKPQDPNP